MKDHIEALKDITTALIEKSLAQERFEKRKDILIEILTTLNFLDDEIQSVDRLLDIVQNYTGVEAVGIRLKYGDDYPYYSTKGFSPEFVEKESSLRCREHIFDDDVDELECMCGFVVRGKDMNNYPFFTKFGSFYTTDASSLVEGKYGPLPINIKVRGVCVKSGYETVVAIPLRCKSNKIVGILQMNDRKKNAVSLDTVEFFEGIGLNIGTALSRIRILKNLRERCICEYGRPYKNNELQFDDSST